MRIAKTFSPVLLLLAPFAVTAAAPVASDSALANGDLDGVAILDDAPYENLANPDAPVRAGWKLFTGYSRSEGADADVSTGLWTTSVAKSWYLGAWTPKLKASWSTQDVTEASASSGTFLAGMDWAPLEDGSFSLQGSWTTQDGQDEPTATVGTDWWFAINEWATLGLDGSGGWSKSADWDGHVGSSLGFYGDLFSLDLSGGWDYRKVEFEAVSGVSGEDYQNVWSASSDARLLWGNWSTGPSWSMEYWKVKIPPQQATTNTAAGRSQSSNHKNKKSGDDPGTSETQILSADGSSLSQEASWNIGWTPLRGWNLDVSGFRTWGQSQLTTKESSDRSSKNSGKFRKGSDDGLQKTTQTSYTPPSESWGGRVSLSIGW